MNRKEIASSFWLKQAPDLSSMLLRKEAPFIDAKERSEILGYLPSFRGKTVLDLAAGIGRFTEEFAKEAKRVVALDFSSRFIERNREKNKECANIEWICCDAMDASFQEQEFDLIFASWLFLYLENEELALLTERLRKWVKPSGHLFFRESCEATSRISSKNGYYAHYRSCWDYEQLFRNWKLVKQGSICAYEKLLADPFKCYWLYQP